MLAGERMPFVVRVSIHPHPLAAVCRYLLMSCMVAKVFRLWMLKYGHCFLRLATAPVPHSLTHSADARSPSGLPGSAGLLLRSVRSLDCHQQITAASFALSHCCEPATPCFQAVLFFGVAITAWIYILHPRRTIETKTKPSVNPLSLGHPLVIQMCLAIPRSRSKCVLSPKTSSSSTCIE